MQSSPRSNEEKQTTRKAKTKASANEPRHLQRKKDKEEEYPAHTDAPTRPIGRVVTEDQYRALVSQKAYQLYEKRQATTHVDDWVEAERLVKTELLAEGRWAGSV